jgi:hypothetical protein
MFTRNTTAEPKTLESRLANSSSNGVQQQQQVQQHRPSGPESNEKSVIGNDLKIIGQGLKIVGRGILQVDGEIEGDVQAAEVIVGEKGIKPIEVKYSAYTKPKVPSGLARFQQEYDTEKGIVLTKDYFSKTETALFLPVWLC